MALSIPKLVARYLGGRRELGIVPATLHVITPGTRTTASAGTNPTTVDYTCRGFVEAYEARYVDGTTVRQDDRKVSLLGATIAGGAVPRPGHKITIKSVAYRVIAVESDPVNAVYTCQCRRGG